ELVEPDARRGTEFVNHNRLIHLRLCFSRSDDSLTRAGGALLGTPRVNAAPAGGLEPLLTLEQIAIVPFLEPFDHHVRRLGRTAATRTAATALLASFLLGVSPSPAATSWRTTRLGRLADGRPTRARTPRRR